MARKINKHVVPYSSQTSKNRWAVKNAGTDRVIKTFPTQKAAIQFSKRVLKKTGGELFIHSRTGRIRERNSYGKDPYPPTG